MEVLENREKKIDSTCHFEESEIIQYLKMAVDNPSIINFISISPNDEVCLTISDHLKWNDIAHYLHLENKINSYLGIIDNNQIYEIYPDAIGKIVLINIALKYKPTKKAIKFLEKVNDLLISKNCSFTYSVIN